MKTKQEIISEIQSLNEELREIESLERAKLAEEYTDPVGWWKVTTEGDCEGRSTKDYGTHYGHAAEVIARLYVNGLTPFYGYKLKKVPEPLTETDVGPEKLIGKEFHFNLDIESLTWDMNNEQIARVVDKAFGSKGFVNMTGVDYSIEPSNYWKSVKIKFL